MPRHASIPQSKALASPATGFPSRAWQVGAKRPRSTRRNQRDCQHSMQDRSKGRDSHSHALLENPASVHLGKAGRVIPSLSSRPTLVVLLVRNRTPKYKLKTTPGKQQMEDIYSVPNSAPRRMGRRALESRQAGQGLQTAVYLPSELSKSRITWHRSGACSASAGLLLEAAGPVYPEEFPYPSTVTGAVPLGAPVTVSWAAAGIADTTPQTAAIDRNVKTKRFI
jgi:hypothetical protein